MKNVCLVRYIVVPHENVSLSLPPHPLHLSYYNRRDISMVIQFELQEGEELLIRISPHRPHALPWEDPFDPLGLRESVAITEETENKDEWQEEEDTYTVF